MRFSAFIAASLILAAHIAVHGEEAALTDGEIWNMGVDMYLAGDSTNALATLKPLLLSREYGARAAEVVAALAYERATTPGAQDAIQNLEEAAAASQIALRAKPDDARLRRNFARAAASLPELRETKHINDVIAAAQGKDPTAILKGARDDSRRILSESASCRTNAPAEAIAVSEALSARTEALADAFIPIREAVAQAATNNEDAATIPLQMDEARSRAIKAAVELADFNPEAYSTLASVESDCTRFHKMVALPPDSIREDLLSQSNAWQDVETVNNRAWQPDALDYTRSFRAKFPAWARQYEQMAQADTNKPPFTAEAQAEISALATQLEKLQIECVKDILPPKQEEALDIIRKIIELLPNDPSQGGGQGAGGANNENKPDKKNDPAENENKDQGDDQRQNESEARQEENPEQNEEAQGEEDKSEEDKEDKDVEAVLKKAQERSDEHEADKKARMRKSALPPNERDW